MFSVGGGGGGSVPLSPQPLAIRAAAARIRPARLGYRFICFAAIAAQAPIAKGKDQAADLPWREPMIF